MPVHAGQAPPGNPLVVAWIRDWLRAQGFQALVVTSEDAHQSEYVAEGDKRVEFVSGFAGSSGTVVISLDHAWLWTDSRYLLQAKQQLDTGVWAVMHALPRRASMAEHLASVLPPESKVAIDPRMLPLGTARTLESHLTPVGHSLVPLETSPIDELWGAGRPALADAPVVTVPVALAGQSVSEKLARVREDLCKSACDALVITALDEVAWLLNVRGADIPYNPLVTSYALVTQDSAVWYVREGVADDNVVSSLAGAGVSVKAYDAIAADLGALAKEEATVMIDAMKCSWHIYHVLRSGGEGGCKVVEQVSPVTWLKSIKNEIEVEGLREAHVRDGVAVCSFLAWLHDAMGKGTPVSEMTASAKLEGFRKQQGGYLYPSFTTIAAYGPNGAVIHYHPTEETNRLLAADSLFLCDSGGQYLFDGGSAGPGAHGGVAGTTDVTRTVCFGAPSEHHKQCYTRVLRGHIALSSLVFPAGTTGHMLDLVARAPLWQVGLDYKHGTGHGVGAMLCVHEGPHLISYYPRDPDPPIRAGIVEDPTLNSQP